MASLIRRERMTDKASRRRLAAAVLPTGGNTKEGPPGLSPSRLAPARTAYPNPAAPMHAPDPPQAGTSARLRPRRSSQTAGEQDLPQHPLGIRIPSPASAWVDIRTKDRPTRPTPPADQRRHGHHYHVPSPQLRHTDSPSDSLEIGENGFPPRDARSANVPERRKRCLQGYTPRQNQGKRGPSRQDRHRQMMTRGSTGMVGDILNGDQQDSSPTVGSPARIHTSLQTTLNSASPSLPSVTRDHSRVACLPAMGGSCPSARRSTVCSGRLFPLRNPDLFRFHRPVRALRNLPIDLKSFNVVQNDGLTGQPDH